MSASVRKIYLIGEINQEMYEQFSNELDVLVDESKVKPIIIELCSGGGEDNTSLAFYGKIRSCPCPVHITAFGEIQSAAVLMLAAGDKRCADPNVIFMVHESSDKIAGDTKELLREAERMEKAEDHYYGLLEEHTKLTCLEWRYYAALTTYFSSEQAVAWGVIDSVLPYKKIKK